MAEVGWTPSKRQAEFLSLPDTIKEALYGGGVNSAKTETLIYYPIIRKFYELPRFKQVIMRRTFPELKREVVPRAKRIYAPFGATWNGGDMVFTFPRGAQVWLGHCETDDDVHKYDSMEINLFTPDELASFLEDQYLYLAFERVRAPLGSGLPKIIRAAGMPGGIGHQWVKRRFIDPYTKIGITDLHDCSRKVILGRGENKRIYIHATAMDNPFTDPDYLKSLDALPEAEKQAKKYGKWDAYLGSVFDEFRPKHYTGEPENAIHVIKPFEIPDYWPKLVIGDWGYNANAWIGFGAVSPNKRLYVYRELCWKRVKIADWAPLVKPYLETEQPRIVRFCQSAKQDRGQDNTIQQQIEEILGCKIELTGNTAGSRIAEKMLLHEFLRWRHVDKIPEKELKPFDHQYSLWLFRNKGLQAYNDYLAIYQPKVIVEETIPKLQIFDICTALITAIPRCEYVKPTIAHPNPEDVAEFDGDDPYDGIRYMCSAAMQFMQEASDEFEKIKMQEQLEAEFKLNPDYNRVFAMARAARYHEKENEILPVRMYH